MKDHDIYFQNKRIGVNWVSFELLMLTVFYFFPHSFLILKYMPLKEKFGEGHNEGFAIAIQYKTYS